MDHVLCRFSNAAPLTRAGRLEALPGTMPAIQQPCPHGGDIGCSGGPTLVGMVSGALGDNMKMGILAGIIFPVLLLIGIILCRMENGDFSE